MPVVVAIVEPGLMNAVKPSVTRRLLARSVDVTGISDVSGISSLTASACSASQNAAAAGRAPGSSGVLPLMFGPSGNSGFDGIVAAPV